ncbi:MAG: EutN/CcmL family microcompartment protein [Planctomycetota bacterium]|nr:EutN/CcmL family microcompartment protein [Planctomycetota bacterium]
MKLGRVIGTVVAPIHHDAYDNRRLLAVRPTQPNGHDADDRLFVAVDRAQAGVGDRVLLMAEGSSVRDLCGGGDLPIRVAVVGVVDEIEMEGVSIYGPGSRPNHGQQPDEKQ